MGFDKTKVVFVFVSPEQACGTNFLRYSWPREGREASCQQCLLTVLTAPGSPEWTWGRRDTGELGAAISRLSGLKLKTKTGIPG